MVDKKTNKNSVKMGKNISNIREQSFWHRIAPRCVNKGRLRVDSEAALKVLVHIHRDCKNYKST